MVNGLSIINYSIYFYSQPFIFCNKFIWSVYIHSFNGNTQDKCQISGIKCPNSTIIIIRAKISCNTRQYSLSEYCLKWFTIIIKCSMWYNLKTNIKSYLFAILIYAAVLYMYNTPYTKLIKSENASLQYLIFFEKVLNQKYLLKLNNVFQTSSKPFVVTMPICFFWCLSYVPFYRLKLYSLNFAIAHARKRLLCLSEFVTLVLHLYTRKLTFHLKQAQKSISNLSNLQKNVKCLPWTKTNWEYQIFGNLPFITIFDNFLLPNQVDLSAHCSYHFSTSNELRLRCNNTLIFLWRFQW